MRDRRGGWGLVIVLSQVALSVSSVRARGAESPADAWQPAGSTSFQEHVASPVLREVVVTGSRAPRDLNSEPAAVYRLDASKACTEEAVRTTPDVLSGLPSVMVQKTAYGQGSPFLRGFTGFRTLCLIDGIRLNNSVFREGPNQYWNTVDPLSIAAYELVMGPASVLYGSDAVGGALNAIPIEPAAFVGAPVWDAQLDYRGATADRSTVGRAQAAARLSEEFGFVGGVSLKDFGDLRGGDEVGRQEHTGYDEQDGDLQLDFHAGRDTILTLGHQTVRQDDAWRTHRTIYGIDWEGLKHGDDKVHTFDQARDLTYLKGRRDKLDGFLDGIEWTVSRHAQGEDQYRVKKDDASERQGFDVLTWGGTVQFDSGTEAGEWVYGIEYYRDGVDSYGRKYNADGSLKSVEIQGPVADEASYDSLGAYVEDTVSVLGGRIDLVPGARYTFSKADADKVKDPATGDPMSVSGDWDALTGSLRALHPLSGDRDHVVFAGVSQGFRAPNLSDLTRFDSARSTEIETPVSDLDPENYLSFEIGQKSRFKDWVSQASYYYTLIDGMIVRAPTGRTVDGLDEVTKKNSGDGYVQGVELSETYAISRAWSTWLAASWMYGKVDAFPTSEAVMERDYISRLMPPTMELGLRWRREDGKYWAEAVGNAAAKADRLSADDERDTQRIPPGGTPGYAVCSVRTGTALTRNLDLSLAVENVLDEDYRIHGSGVNEPGRNVVLTARASF
jgi:hemoglobin/transferrin/lactoferrin receptor protein